MEVRMDGGTDGWRYGWMELIIKGQTCILYCMQMSVIYVPTTLAQVKNCPSVFYNQGYTHERQKTVHQLYNAIMKCQWYNHSQPKH